MSPALFWAAAAAAGSCEAAAGNDDASVDCAPPSAFGAAVLFGLLLWLAFHAARRVDARERARLALAARADQQHGWVLADDDRGIYGDYVPTQIVGQFP